MKLTSEQRFNQLESTVNRAYEYIDNEYAQLEYALDNDHYESAYEIASNIRRTITLIKNTRTALDALDITLDEAWEFKT